MTRKWKETCDICKQAKEENLQDLNELVNNLRIALAERDNRISDLEHRLELKENNEYPKNSVLCYRNSNCWKYTRDDVECYLEILEEEYNDYGINLQQYATDIADHIFQNKDYIYESWFEYIQKAVEEYLDTHKEELA